MSVKGGYMVRQTVAYGLLIMLILTVFSGTAMAQQNGTIRGVVKDKQSGEPLIGVNISVKGTYLGASTDTDGFFLIPDVESGEYEIEISYIGYKVIRQTGIQVGTAQTLTLNFEMETTALSIGQEVEVIGEKPLLDLEGTSTVRNLTSADLQNRIVNDAIDVVSQQVGVVQQDNAIHIRGGRAYEAQYLLDGVSVQDPLSGTGFGLNVSANAIEEVEVITGGFKAEMGQATSGVVKVKTKTGDEDYEMGLDYRSDHFGVFEDRDFSFNNDQFEFYFGGPEPISNNLLKAVGLDLPGDMFIFFNLYAQLADDYTGATSPQLISSIAPTFNGLLDETSLAPRQNNNWSGLFKLTWKPNPVNVITWSYNRSLSISQNTQLLQTNLEFVEPSPGFPYDFSLNLAEFNTYTHHNEQTSLGWQKTVNKTTFFEILASRFFTHLRSDWEGRSWEDYRQPFDVARLPLAYFFQDDGEQVRVIPGDGFYDYGNAFIWHDHYLEAYTLKGDITSRIGEIHTVKAGFESSFNELQLIDIADPWVGTFGSSQDIYRVNPADGAFFVQDDIDLNGFYLNAGVRLDWWAPGKFADDAVADTNSILTDGVRQKYTDETFGVFGRRVKARLMPRLAVSFPISNNQMLYLNYGHFSKRPKPQFVYAKLSPSSSRSSFQNFGNPSLSPETSVKYELGLRNKLTEDDVISITAFYQDIFDYVQTISVPNIPRVGRGITYINQDYARSRGVEVEYKTRIGRNFFGDLSGSYSITTTKSSNADAGRQVASGELDEPPINEVWAQWDRPWQVGANLSLRFGKGDHARLFGLKLFDDWYMNLRYFAQAGKRYSPQDIFGESVDGRILYATTEDQSQFFSEIASNWQWVDFSFTKNFAVAGLQYGFQVEIKNLFSNQNAQIINPVTGKAYEFGDPTPSGWNDPLFPDRFYPISNPFPLNPARYMAPRNIRFGLSVDF